MTRDTVRDNMNSYLGDRARQDWSATLDLFPVERAIIERHFPPPPARILDIGCGAGRTTVGLEAMGYDVEAIDLSEDLVDEARKHLTRTRVQLMDARTLAFPDATFDAVLFSFNGLDCLHPLPERHRVLQEVLRVLAPGAPFYYSGHNALAAWGPRPGDTVAQLVRRDGVLFRAQLRSFEQRGRYMVYPDAHGAQILYSALPHTHVREQRALGFEPICVYGSRSYRRGPHLDGIAADAGTLERLRGFARVSLTCPHVHYVVKKPGR